MPTYEVNSWTLSYETEIVNLLYELEDQMPPNPKCNVA